MTAPVKLQRLDGWKQISAWLGWTQRSCREIELESRSLDPEMRMPVARRPGQQGGKGQRVYANAAELDAWQERWLSAARKFSG